MISAKKKNDDMILTHTSWKYFGTHFLKIERDKFQRKILKKNSGKQSLWKSPKSGHFFENKKNPVKRLASDMLTGRLEPEMSFSCE